MIHYLNNFPDVYEEPEIRVRPTRTGYDVEVGFTDQWDNQDRWRPCAHEIVFTKLGVYVAGWRLTRWYKRYVKRMWFTHDIDSDTQT